MNKGYQGKSVHDMVRKGYTKAHIKNSKKKGAKKHTSPVSLHTGAQLEEGNNNFEGEIE